MVYFYPHFTDEEINAETKEFFSGKGLGNDM